jgi:hypothetical protein
MNKNNAFFKKYKDPRWQKKRLEIMERDEFSCLDCGDSEKTLNVHHKWYEKDTAPWDYPDECYETLCEDCHKEHENTKSQIKEYIKKLYHSEQDQLLGYLKALDPNLEMSGFIKVDNYENIIGVCDYFEIKKEDVNKFVNIGSNAHKLSVMDLYEAKRRK